MKRSRTQGNNNGHYSNIDPAYKSLAGIWFKSCYSFNRPSV